MYIHLGSSVTGKTAKLFVNGGSQAVRLPAEFRFADADEVYIRRDEVTGDIVLSARRITQGWKGFFALRDNAEVEPDFMAERPLNEPLADPLGEAPEHPAPKASSRATRQAPAAGTRSRKR